MQVVEPPLWESPCLSEPVGGSNQRPFDIVVIGFECQRTSSTRLAFRCRNRKRFNPVTRNCEIDSLSRLSHRRVSFAPVLQPLRWRSQPAVEERR